MEGAASLTVVPVGFHRYGELSVRMACTLYGMRGVRADLRLQLTVVRHGMQAWSSPSGSGSSLCEHVCESFVHATWPGSLQTCMSHWDMIV